MTPGTFHCAAAALIFTTGQALAAGPEPLSVEPEVAAPVVQEGPALVFTFRGGVAAGPDYFGSEDYSLRPDIGFRFHYLRLPGGREFGSADPTAENLGWGLRGSFRFIRERSSDDNPELAGLDDVDAAFEAGLGIGYRAQNFRAFADARYGVVGHESWVARAGADLIARPSDRLSLSIGPRLFWGDDGYSSTYFGVSAAEASADLPEYDADGGILTAGVELGARYRVTDNWGVEGAVTWNRLTGDAADSPIVQQGSEDQWRARIGISRVIRWGR